MNKIRIGTVYPGFMGNYEEDLEIIDLDEMNPLDFMDIIKEKLDELQKSDEGELVIVPHEQEVKEKE